jgi:hypothetical protein
MPWPPLCQKEFAPLFGGFLCEESLSLMLGSGGTPLLDVRWRLVMAFYPGGV